MKKTDIFDKLDNVIGNHMEGHASDVDVIKIAYDVNEYLVKNPHRHDINAHEGVTWWKAVKRDTKPEMIKKSIQRFWEKILTFPTKYIKTKKKIKKWKN